MMESLVAKASSSLPTMTIQQKVSRNKRKFRAEMPSTDQKITLEPRDQATSYEFTADNSDNMQSHSSSISSETISTKHDKAEALQLDLGLSCAAGASRTEFRARPSMKNADWNDRNESELEKLIYSNLDSNLKSAMKRVMAYGYNEEVVFAALSKAGQCHGMKDTVANLVDSTLIFLRGGQDIRALRDYNFEDILELEQYMIAESVCVVKQMKPSASTSEAMWFLLVCDTNISHGCVIEADLVSSMAASSPVLPFSEQKTLEPSLVGSIQKNSSFRCLSHNEVVSNPYGHTFQSVAPNSTFEASIVPNGHSLEKSRPTSSSAGVEKTFSLAGASHFQISEEKFVGCRKVSGMTKREYILRQKALHVEKHHRMYGAKGTSRTGKLNHFGGLVLDKKLRHIANSTCLNRNTLKIGNTIGVDLPQDNINGQTFPPLPAFSMENDDITSTSSEPSVDSAADTELSLSLPTENGNATIEPVNKVDPERALEDKKEEMIHKLSSRVEELQNHLQEWTEWANHKVMQAARRLGKDKAELKLLRQEKEEVERLKKEKQSLEENTMKKLSEMENALRKASGQVERANGAVRRLQVENGTLRKEMEVSRFRAAESSANFEAMLKSEKETMTRFQSEEKLKSMFSEEMTAEKRKLVDLSQKLELAEDLRNQLEARCDQEVKAKEELLSQANHLRKEREQTEAALKSREHSMRSKGENHLHKHKDEMQKLEAEISKLRLKMDSPKLTALSYSSKLTDVKSTLNPQKSQTQYISKPASDSDIYSGCVKRERECVMCLSEEMCVVFLPCAHQVVCKACNELHEKQGMEDCPSCRSPIQKRICVRYARA